MRALINRLMVALVFSVLFTNAYAASVRIEGFTEHTQQSAFTQQDKEHQVRVALYRAITNYYQQHNQRLLTQLKQKVPEEVMIKNVLKLVGEYDVQQEIGDDNTLITEVIALFDSTGFHTKMSNLIANDTPSTVVLVEFISPSDDTLKPIASLLDVSLKAQLSRNPSVNVAVDYQELQMLTGGAFNFLQVRDEFNSNGSISPAGLNIAAKAKAGFSDAFSVVAYHQLKYDGVDDMLGVAHQVKVRSQVNVYNANTGELVASEALNNELGTGDSIQQAAQNGLNRAARKLSEKLIGIF